LATHVVKGSVGTSFVSENGAVLVSAGAAVNRTFYEFLGLCGVLTHGWKLDDQGRTWYDAETGCTVVLIGDDCRTTSLSR
jgi:hypothetical protein